MTFATVPDKTVGDPFTEQMWDSYIKDNMNKGVVRPIADSLLVGSVASFDFQSILADFAHLRLVLSGRGDNATANIGVQIRMNNDSGANYDYQVFRAAGTTLTGTEFFAQTSIQVANIPGSTATANFFGVCTIEIPGYTGATGFKPIVATNYQQQGSSAGQTITQVLGGSWRSAGVAINRLTVFPAAGNFIAGSRATLYGLPN